MLHWVPKEAYLFQAHLRRGGGGGGLNRDGGIISFRKDDGISSNNGKEM